MNDSLIIAGYTVLTASLMAGSFALGRWERRTIYKPGPPDLDRIREAENSLLKATAAALTKDYTVSTSTSTPTPAIVYGDPLKRETWVSPGGFLIMPPEMASPVEESVRLVPRYPAVSNLSDEAEEEARAERRRFLFKLGHALDVGPWTFNDWGPPGTNADAHPAYDVSANPDEQAYWLRLLGDPTKKEQS